MEKSVSYITGINKKVNFDFADTHIDLLGQHIKYIFIPYRLHVQKRLEATV